MILKPPIALSSSWGFVRKRGMIEASASIVTQWGINVPEGLDGFRFPFPSGKRPGVRSDVMPARAFIDSDLFWEVCA